MQQFSLRICFREKDPTRNKIKFMKLEVIVFFNHWIYFNLGDNVTFINNYVAYCVYTAPGATARLKRN